MSAALDMGMASEAPYFFLSYAHTPKLPDDHRDPDKWIAKLYADLRRHVIQRVGGKSADVGFMDREMRPGVLWPSQLAHALSCCRVFVPLYSPRYFESEDCGKEWSAFNQRVLSQAARRNKPPVEAIVPALWVPVEPDRLPPVAKSIQFSHHSLGAAYSEEGFWGIMKVKRYRDDYEFAVLRLAQHIVRVARQTMLDREVPPDYLALHSAFADGAGPQEHRRPETARQSGRRVRVVIAAPTTRDIPASRRGRAYYGATEREWNPYHPQSQVPIADYAVDITSRLGYRPVVVSLDDVSAVQASEPAAPGLVVVDPWTAAIDRKATELRQLDEKSERWNSVLVPWNRNDEETMAAEPSLRPRVNGTLCHMLDRTPPQFRRAVDDIATLSDFADILPHMVRVADNRFLRDARAYPPGGPAMPRPTLFGPHDNNSKGTV